jgi:hypothetical protein
MSGGNGHLIAFQRLGCKQRGPTLPMRMTSGFDVRFALELECDIALSTRP